MDLFTSYDVNSLIIRPHPRLSEYSIEYFTDILSIKLSKNNIVLSEELKRAPL